jgi:hypothetical protein
LLIWEGVGIERERVREIGDVQANDVFLALLLEQLPESYS